MEEGVTYPEPVGSVESVSQMRDLLLDTSKIPWIQLVGQSDWIKLIKVGVMYRNCTSGMAFEAIRDGLGLDSEFELFHMCRIADCRFTGTKNANYNGPNGIPRTAIHVSRFAFSDKAAAAVTLAERPGPVDVARAVKGSRKSVAGAIIVVLGLAVRLKQALSEMSPGVALSGAISVMMTVGLGNLVSGFNLVEEGVMDGVTTFFWDGHPEWAHWVTRLFVYLGVAWYLGGRNCMQRIWKPKRGTCAAPKEPTPSDVASDSGDKSCQADSLYMALPHKRTPLCQIPCLDSITDLTPLIREDHEVSRLPSPDLDLGLPLCKTHRDIYQAIRSNQVCNVMQCMRLGVSGPEGKHYCKDHMISAVLPQPVGPKVKFEGDKVPKSPAVGLENIPDEVLLSLVNKMLGTGVSESGVVEQLTTDYGGSLLHNALRIKELTMAEKGDANVTQTAPHIPIKLEPGIELVRDIQSHAESVPGPSTNDAHARNITHHPLHTSEPNTGSGVRILQGKLVEPKCNGTSGTVYTPPLVGSLDWAGPATTNVFHNIPLSGITQSGASSFGTADALPPVADQGESNKWLASIGYNIDRLANPETQAKPGTLDSVKRNEEIWVFVARYFNNFHVSLCPGVVGKQLATGLKSLNDRLRPLYESIGLPNGFTNRVCLGAANFAWGGRTGDSDHVLSEQDFTSWTPHQFDSYIPPADWTLETKSRQSGHIETWKVNAQNMSKQFSSLYGTEHLQERLQAIEDMRALHVREPHKYTLPFIRNAWGTLNHRWIQELKESTNVLRLHAGVERPTFDQLKAVGMTVDPSTGSTVFRMPGTFKIRDPAGYFQTEIVRK